MEAKKEEGWTIGLRSPGWMWSAILLTVASFAMAVLTFGLNPAVPSPWGLPGGPLTSAFLLFFIPVVVGSALSSPIAQIVGGKLNLKRALLVGLISLVPLGGAVLAWRAYHFLTGGGLVEGDLLVTFGVLLWLNQMLIAGISGPTPIRTWPPALAAPVAGVLAAWVFLGAAPWAIAEGILFLLIALLTGYLLLYGTDVPLKREFGEGAISIVRPLFDHMNERDPEASRRMEKFFERTCIEEDLSASVVAFGVSGVPKVAWVVPSVHPGPFAEIGASDLPHKLATRLAPVSREIVVPHSPCTHDQNIPTTEDIDKVAEELRRAISGLKWDPRARASGLVSPYPDSMVRAQMLGEALVMIVTRAPEASDDIDYSVGEMVREEARRLGFRDPVVIDAHNSFVGKEQSTGTVPFGSPASFKLKVDAVAAMHAARNAAVDGPIRVGFARRKGYTPQKDGIGKEGLTVTLVEAGGAVTAYALFDGNNLVQGLRAKFRDATKGMVDELEVMTTDNHAVHEVEGGINPVGLLRKGDRLSADLKEALTIARSDLTQVEVASASSMVRGVKVMGPGISQKLVTSLSDSFHLFWMLLPTTFTLTLLAELLILAIFP